MTAGEQLMAQGVERGERGLLLRLLRQRFGAEVDREIEARLAVAAAADIETWSGRIFSAATIADVFAS